MYRALRRRLYSELLEVEDAQLPHQFQVRLRSLEHKGEDATRLINEWKPRFANVEGEGYVSDESAVIDDDAD